MDISQVMPSHPPFLGSTERGYDHHAIFVQWDVAPEAYIIHHPIGRRSNPTLDRWPGNGPGMDMSNGPIDKDKIRVCFECLLKQQGSGLKMGMWMEMRMGYVTILIQSSNASKAMS